MEQIKDWRCGGRGKENVQHSICLLLALQVATAFPDTRSWQNFDLQFRRRLHASASPARLAAAVVPFPTLLFLPLSPISFHLLFSLSPPSLTFLHSPMPTVTLSLSPPITPPHPGLNGGSNSHLPNSFSFPWEIDISTLAH